MMASETLSKLAKAVEDLSPDEAVALTNQALSEGVKASEIVLGGLSKGMEGVGKKFEECVYFLADLVYAADIMNRCLDVVKPYLEKDVKTGAKSGTLVIGTVLGDLHDIGKNLVGNLVKAAGFEVVDLGVDVPVDRFVNAVKQHQPDFLGMSALLTTTAGYYKIVIDALKKEGLRDKVFVMIGGPQASEAFAKEVGADAYGKDAIQAVHLCKTHARKR